jgi:hypothetical protein
MIKAVNEVIDRILKGYGQLIIQNFSRAVIRSKPVDITIAALGMIVYGVAHSFILTMEMFTIHVVLTSSMESIFSFLFYNNFNEIKIWVFKK